MTANQPTTTQPAPAWDEATRAGITLDDVCTLNDDYADDPNPPWPYLASGPGLCIFDISACEIPDTFNIGDPFGTVIITPHGPVLRMEAHVHQGTMPARGCWRAETVYGARETLEAIGAINIYETPY